MSITQYAPRAEYIGTGLLSSYSFDFKVAAIDHLLVTVTSASFVQTFKVRGDDSTYIASSTFDSIAGGGSIDLVSNLPNGHFLTILLANDDPLQESEFRDKGSFTLRRFEEALDVVAGAVQRLTYLANRSLKVSDTLVDTHTAQFDFSIPINSITEAVEDNTNKVICIGDNNKSFKLGPTITSLSADAAAAVASAAAASASASASAVSAAAALSSQTAAGISAGTASTAQTAASSSASSASTSATNASTSATNAATSATNASTSADASAVSATASSGSAISSAASASAANSSAGAASTSAINAAASAVAAAASEIASAASATAAATSAAAAAIGAQTYPALVTAIGAVVPGSSGSKFYLFDSTLGDQSITLPTISAANNGLTFSAKKISSDVNTVTWTGQIEGVVNPTIDYLYTGQTVVAIGGDWYWKN